MRRIRNILVPTDFSQAAEAARKYAESLAVTFKSRLHLLHIAASPLVIDPLGTEALALRVADLLAMTEEAARGQLRTLVPKEGPLAGRVRVRTDTGQTVERILNYIKRHHVDLVVMGTHGRGPAGRWLLGNVAERVVRHSPVPVLTLHTPPGKVRKRTTSRVR